MKRNYVLLFELRFVQVSLNPIKLGLGAETISINDIHRHVCSF